MRTNIDITIGALYEKVVKLEERINKLEDLLAMSIKALEKEIDGISGKSTYY